jgi:hypothetical protein
MLACAILVVADRVKTTKERKDLRAIALLLHDDDISTIASLIASRVSDFVEPLHANATDASARAVEAAAVEPRGRPSAH